MKNTVTNQTDAQQQYTLWQYGKSTASLTPSAQSMVRERKEIIRIALRCEITDIRTYSGYKGDLLVQITATHFPVLQLLKSSAEVLGMQTVLKTDHRKMTHALYCITPDNVYALKEPR